MERTTEAMKQQYKDLTNAVLRLQQQDLDEYKDVSEPFYGTGLLNKFIQIYSNELLKKEQTKRNEYYHGCANVNSIM